MTQAILLRVLKAQPDFLEARNNLAAILNEMGDHEAAIRELRTLIEADPSYVTAHFNLAMIFIQRERMEEALAELRATSRLDAKHTQALKYESILLSTSRDRRIANVDEAVRLAERALELGGRRDLQLFQQLVRDYRRAGDAQRALAIAREALPLARTLGDAEAVRSIEDYLRRNGG